MTTPPGKRPRHRKKQLNARLSDEAHAIIGAARKQLGITKTDALEMALRLLRERHHLHPTTVRL